MMPLLLPRASASAASSPWEPYTRSPWAAPGAASSPFSAPPVGSGATQNEPPLSLGELSLDDYAAYRAMRTQPPASSAPSPPSGAPTPIAGTSTAPAAAPVVPDPDGVVSPGAVPQAPLESTMLYVLGVPRDFSPRDASLLFALAPECIGCDLYRQTTSDLYVVARFRTLQAAQSAQIALDHRPDIMGAQVRFEIRGPPPAQSPTPAQTQAKKSRFAFVNDDYAPTQPQSPLGVFPPTRSIFGGDWTAPPLTPRSPTSARRLSSVGSLSSAAASSGSTASSSTVSLPPAAVAAPAFQPAQPPPKSQRVMPPANPADRNPPCNTLYVGNLPQDTSEDELLDLFSVRPGYKRLCFRTKQNGPMCFVEFENETYAGQALEDLYGVGLSNSVKGGIRLSYSKNPLGVRSKK